MIPNVPCFCDCPSMCIPSIIISTRNSIKYNLPPHQSVYIHLNTRSKKSDMPTYELDVHTLRLWLSQSESNDFQNISTQDLQDVTVRDECDGAPNTCIEMGADASTSGLECGVSSEHVKADSCASRGQV